jgi:hypothetical protein
MPEDLLAFLERHPITTEVTIKELTCFEECMNSILEGTQISTTIRRAAVLRDPEEKLKPKLLTRFQILKNKIE